MRKEKSSFEQFSYIPRKQFRIFAGVFVLLLTILNVGANEISNIIKRLDIRINEIIEENEEFKQRNDKLETQLAEAKLAAKDRERLKNRLEALLEETHHLRRQLDGARGRIEELKRENERLLEETGIAKEKERLQDEREAWITEKKEWREQLRELQDQNQRLRNRLQTVSLEREKLKQDLKKAQRKSEEFRRKWLEHDSQQKNTGEDGSHTDPQTAELHRRARELQDKNERLWRELTKTREAVEEKNRINTEQDEEIKKQEEEIKELKELNNSLEFRNQEQLRLIKLLMWSPAVSPFDAPDLDINGDYLDHGFRD